MKFFVLRHRSDPSQTSALTQYVAADPQNVGDEPATCKGCGEPVSMLPWLPPHNVEIECWGKAAGDIVSGPGDDLLISQRLKALVEEHGLAGFVGFDPVNVVRVRRKKRFKGKVPPYYRVNVVRSEAAVDQAKSGVEWLQGPICPVCRMGEDLRRWKRVILEAGSWTGEDIFEARGLAATYITTERFKSICEQYKIANAVLIPAEEYGRDFYPWEREEVD